VDTVPFALWCAATHLDDYPAALWATASAGGDVDTTCAIVGGIVAAHVGTDGIPFTWQEAVEPLPHWADTDRLGSDLRRADLHRAAACCARNQSPCPHSNGPPASGNGSGTAFVPRAWTRSGMSFWKAIDSSCIGVGPVRASSR
jgi:hypothetical protein